MTEHDEREAFLDEVPMLRGMIERGEVFEALFGAPAPEHDEPIPSDEEIERVAPDHIVERIAARAMEQAGYRYVPALPAELQVHRPLHLVRASYRPRWKRVAQSSYTRAAAVIMAIGAVGGLAFEGGLRVQAAHSQHETAVFSKTHTSSAYTSFDSAFPASFSGDGGQVHGTIAGGELDIQNIGSVGDSGVVADLERGHALIELGPKVRGMLLRTPVAEVQLLLPGKYEIDASQPVGSVKVDSGVAQVTVHGISSTVVRQGETARMEKGKAPVRLR